MKPSFVENYHLLRRHCAKERRWFYRRWCGGGRKKRVNEYIKEIKLFRQNETCLVTWQRRTIRFWSSPTLTDNTQLYPCVLRGTLHRYWPLSALVVLSMTRAADGCEFAWKWARRTNFGSSTQCEPFSNFASITSKLISGLQEFSKLEESLLFE